MNKIYILLFFFYTILTSQAQVNNYENGDTVNDFTVVDVYGSTHNLYSYTAQGKYVFLDFFYSACGGCQNFVPVFNEFYDKYGCNQGEVVCIAINSGVDKDEAVIIFENTYGGSFNHAPAISRDGGSADVNYDFDPKYYPACVLIGPDNMMVNADIHPIQTVADLEAAFPANFNPQPLICSLSMHEIVTELDFSIFPNPSNGQEISIENPTKSVADIIIYNILGNVIFNDKIDKTRGTINPKLNTGTYLISFKSTHGITTRKLIVL